jgi:hypothetical protein
VPADCTDKSESAATSWPEHIVERCIEAARSLRGQATTTRGFNTLVTRASLMLIFD